MKKTKLYFIWEEDPNDEQAGGYWCSFQSLEDAVSQGGDGVEVFTAELRRLGRFRRKAEIVKIKSRKKILKKSKKK